MCSSSVRHSSDLLRPRRSRGSAGAAATQPAKEEGDAEHAEQPDEAQEAERPQRARAAATPQGTRLI